MTEPLDIIWGAEAIGALIGKSRKATFHLLERGQIPGTKIGRQWCVSRRELTEHFRTSWRQHFEGTEDAA